jgi:HPt (histidine-containing phosphotransfer) domain-containing protein
MAELALISDGPALSRLLEGFGARSAQIVAELAATAAQGPLAGLAPLCHEAAGAAAVIGAPRLSARMAALEAACAAGDRAALQAGLAGLEALWHETRAALADRFPAAPPG